MKQPWWEDNLTIACLILGLPVIGSISIGALSLIGINTSKFPDMFSEEFFMIDLGVKLLTLPIGVFLVRGLMRSMSAE